MAAWWQRPDFYIRNKHFCGAPSSDGALHFCTQSSDSAIRLRGTAPGSAQWKGERSEEKPRSDFQKLSSGAGVKGH
jgi:hypothetical protein